MDKSPFFSIIIPTYNSADKLKRALDSIDKQSFKDFEVIVSDDGSLDHTKQIIDGFFAKFHLEYIWGENWGGPARPRNKGIKIAQGEYIAFLDADDWWYPNKLLEIKERLDDSDIIFHDLDIYSPRGKKLFKKVRGRQLKQPVFIDLMTKTNALINSSVVVRKAIIDQVGGFAEGFLTCVEDFDLWLRIAQVTEKFKYIPKSLGAYWIDSESVSAPSVKIIERMNFVYDKHLNYLDDADRKEAVLTRDYLLGRVNHRMGLLDEALRLFSESSKTKNFNFKLRSLFWLIAIKIKLSLNKQ